MIQTLDELRDYFSSLVDWHPDITEFHYGDSEEIQSADRSRINYPILWLETPDIDYQVPKFEKTYKCFLVLLVNTRKDDWSAHESEKHRMSIILDHLIRKLHEDHRNALLHTSLTNIKAEPVFPHFGTDHCVGWRLTIFVRAPLAECPPEF